jgi:RNA polymerase sigma-70 factor (ECF subfamily)
MVDDPERGLFEAAARGDRAALEALWRRERRRVAAVLIAHRPREEDLEDLLQEVGVVLVERLGEVRDPARLGAWLRTVALNVARGAGRGARRSRARRRGLDSAAGAPDPGGELPRARTDARDELRQVLAWVEGLTPALAEPLLLRAVWGLAQREIAEWLGVPETTVETRLARARRMLRERIEDADRLRRAE